MNPADIIQNDAIGASLLSQSVCSFSKRDKNGMPLVLCCTILPLVFHRQSCRQINGRRGDGAFYRVVEETPKVAAGLETRMKATLSQTFDALNLALATGRIKYMPASSLFVGESFNLPAKYSNSDVSQKLRAAKKLGEWFAVVGVAQVSALLNLRM